MNKAVIYQYKGYLDKEEVGRLQQLFEHNYETIVRELGLKREFPEIKREFRGRFLIKPMFTLFYYFIFFTCDNIDLCQGNQDYYLIKAIIT